MGSPARLYRTFVDARGVRWGVEARLLGEGADAIPVSFAFTSERSEHRALDGSTPECLSWEQFDDDDWCQLLTVARLVRASQSRIVRTRYLPARLSSHR
jgi:hypothetical protein